MKRYLGSAQKTEKSSTLGLEYTVKKNLRIVVLHTIQEPLQKAFQNTPYLGQSDDFRTFGGFPKFGNFQNFNYIIQLGEIMKIPKLWTPTHCAKIIGLNKVRGVLKTSFQWLLNGIKQTNPNVFFDCVLMA